MGNLFHCRGNLVAFCRQTLAALVDKTQPVLGIRFASCSRCFAALELVDLQLDNVPPRFDQHRDRIGCRMKRMKKSDLEKYRQSLLHLHARLRGDVDLLTTKALSGQGGNDEIRSPTHMAELGSDAWEQDFALRFAENDQETLTEITEALDRIESGTFGLCQGCSESGKPVSKCGIARTRLNAIPYARNCIECERRREEMV